MMRNNHGDMGFMEAIVAMMAVSVVIGLYVSFVSVTAVAAYDPLDDFDENSVELKYDGGIQLASDSYLYTYMANKDLKGLSIELIVPHYESESVVHLVGVSEGTEYTQRYMVLSDYDDGRKVPVIMGVTAFV